MKITPDANIVYLEHYVPSIAVVEFQRLLPTHSYPLKYL